MCVVKGKILFFSMVFVLIFLTGCVNKKAVTTNEFINVVKSNGYEVKDVKDQFNYDYIKEATLAINDDYQIEFYVLDNASNAKKMFESNKQIFESYKSGVSTEASSNVGNNSTFTLNSNGYYMYLSRIDNTLLYIRVESKYKDNVKSIVSKLGY